MNQQDNSHESGQSKRHEFTHSYHDWPDATGDSIRKAGGIIQTNPERKKRD